MPGAVVALGVAFRGESLAPVAAFGTALVLLGAYLTSRGQCEHGAG